MKELTATQEILEDKAKLETDIKYLLNEFTNIHGNVEFDIKTEYSCIVLEGGVSVKSHGTVEVNLTL